MRGDLFDGFSKASGYAQKSRGNTRVEHVEFVDGKRRYCVEDKTPAGRSDRGYASLGENGILALFRCHCGFLFPFRY